MVKPQEEDGPSAAPFLEKSYEMVDDENTDSIISWGGSGDSFVIWDVTQFSVQLLPKYFKHSNFSSFMRQLNIYGFRKVETDRWEFANDGFIRGKRHLLKNISRRKHPHSNEPKKSSHPQQSDNSVRSVNGVDSSRLLKDVENLKNDRNVLMQEFVKLRQLQETSENKLLVLRERVQGMEKNQQQMLSFLVMAMQNPGFLVQLFHPKENYFPMLEQGGVINGGKQPQLFSDGRLLSYESVLNGLPNPEFSSCSGSRKASGPNSDQTFDGTKDAFLGIDLMKMLMDETSKFTLDGFIIPDFPDDGSWRELLLASPFITEETERGKKGPTGPTICDTNMTESHSFEQLMEQIGRSQGLDGNEAEFDGADSEDNETMDSLTEQMEHLDSGTNGPS
ncbi:heat stress transcription factor A-8 [Punica granatum]|uniref:HSF-type DNA-binding domain-containing protein n=2 Tax=Punica granatum TaxID=22663 RepID=A0A218XNB0_PUNGR|nr:heat stress transcription factor A-8 [Punica granatum]OWM86290.1 hypothetical protein CDL15_Pgr011114 [Punica granatum]PKI59820.1 hypothetical protein CRG98_019826 [Punica granatum]